MACWASTTHGNASDHSSVIPPSSRAQAAERANSVYRLQRLCARRSWRALSVSAARTSDERRMSGQASYWRRRARLAGGAPLGARARFDRIAELIEARRGAMLRSGRGATLEQWIATIPP